MRVCFVKLAIKGQKFGLFNVKIEASRMLVLGEFDDLSAFSNS